MSAFVASLIAGAATGLGALPFLRRKSLSALSHGLLLGLGAGFMLAATLISLLAPAYEGFAQMHGAGSAALLKTLLALAPGLAFMAFIAWLFPEEKLQNLAGQNRSSSVSTTAFATALFPVLAITLHNIPEGFAVGAGMAGGDSALGLSVALAIGLQNIPEGFLVAGLLSACGMNRNKAVILALMTGLIEPLAALTGGILLRNDAAYVPVALAVAAGCMAWVLIRDLLPEVFHNSSPVARRGLVVGFCIMTLMSFAVSGP